ncbi:hypothetical protein BCR43DRAFT_490905 [Syncephalastrum racemosum]|uniref:RNI-like protein n=1 Tax=Syncephalastrum racemosum TaxID=13706 RepID=A0A1X2HGM4_SYNRA|nr:hypothetical protein BCR43DRAFT_490905 [Syncephalastrum racemosum]
MVWGGNDNAVERWVKQLRENDPKLTTLHIMSMRRLSSQDLVSIFSALSTNTTLKHLYCSGHVLDTPAVEALAEALTLNDSLESLNVGAPDFGQQHALFQAFAEGLAANEGLIELDLENKQIGDEAMDLLGEALQKNPSLRRINLARNQIGDASLMRWAAQDTTRLQSLNVASNNVGAPGAQALIPALQHLHVLDLSDNALDTGAVALAAALHHSTLRTLKLVNTTEHGDALMDALRLEGNQYLACLWLDQNHIQHVPESLTLGVLTELRIRENQLDDAAALRLATALQNHPHALSLDLGQNAIQYRGMDALLGANISYLGLFSNQIHGLQDATDDTLDLSASVVERLDLGCNSITADDLAVVVGLLLQEGAAPRLRLLEMGGNHKPDELEAWEAQMEALQAARPDLEVVWKLAAQQEDQPPM